MEDPPILVWLRSDLRLADNPALREAAGTRRAVVPVYIPDDGSSSVRPPGAASRWWLHHSLCELSDAFAERGTRLVLRAGEPLRELRRLAEETGATSVFWNRRYEPGAIACDRRVKEGLVADGLEARSFAASLLWEPWTIANGQGLPYRVFTAFWNAARRGSPVAAPLSRPRALAAPSSPPRSLAIEELDLLPHIDWAGGLAEAWKPGERGAAVLLRSFIGKHLQDYPEARDLPATPGTSRLSPHLAFGEVSPRQAWAAAEAVLSAGSGPAAAAAEAWMRQLAWREFGHYLLYHFPRTATAPLREEFARLPSLADEGQLRAWQRGLTGYPIVDAGMRELWHTGWMHNRVRMIVASFLTKDLLAPWQTGEEWFWDTLVDANQANNVLGWQWTAGSGADAAPFFRIFNPVAQGERFDAAGAYVRRWVPELAALPDKFLHKPWTAPDSALETAGLMLGRDYPLPLVDHGEARRRALAAFQDLKATPGKGERA
jgi:deoxyribodipyrimidine photo-lyase